MSYTASFSQKAILPDFHADPSAHKWDGKYWIYPSTDEPESKSWREMRRWHCYSSTDLVSWTNEGEIFNLDSVSWADYAAYAPDAMKWKGKYYFFFPAAYNIGVAISDKPNGPFQDALGKPLIKKY
ncbi:MAG: family 43 glycosylhydrolase, partial [Ekhidna sp.]|nr:family 43 glycosylhydrolase [Ekhidna sp.]